MIPAPFAYERAATLDEALERLAADGGVTRPLAGGQSLLPLMKLRLAQPERLLDIGRLAELRRVRPLDGGGLALGSLTTWTELLDDARVTAYAALGDALPSIADLQVRNRGTIGGGLAHADPASDAAAPLLALDAVVVARSVRGAREIPMTEFELGPFATALAPDELIVEVRLPAPRPDTGSAYRSLPQPASGYPIAGVAAVVGDGLVRVAVTGVGEAPYRAAAAEAALLAGSTPAEAAALATEEVRVNADLHAGARYRAAMAGVMARRAIEAAIARRG